jgi:hypothetical protein
VVDKVAQEQALSEYFRFPFQNKFHPLMSTRLSSMTGTMSPLLADAPSGHNLTPLHAINRQVISLKYFLAISHIMVAETFIIIVIIILLLLMEPDGSGTAIRHNK